ncbi:hypothetical protein ACOMHN_049272 [Nucella lapillus]
MAFSSILPARGKHSFNNSIAPSNHSLSTACDQSDVTFIDHCPTFAPDSGLYTDTCHPNIRGMQANHFLMEEHPLEDPEVHPRGKLPPVMFQDRIQLLKSYMTPGVFTTCVMR